ncbi:hypothetical protein J2S05_003707 [Alkalicoccobacillus murimartini]|uniref:Uncharacterized protein n=1 Tax=Alkalicoccobacillus murimartini TaxID=171685 RepID=A0ABT9YM04_9BACI|nr:hypothetical protein [Alkalicoccobacillus murimartini]
MKLKRKEIKLANHCLLVSLYFSFLVDQMAYKDVHQMAYDDCVQQMMYEGEFSG